MRRSDGGECQRSAESIGNVSLPVDGVKYVNLVAFGQRGQPSVGRQDADLGAGAAGQVAAARFILVLRIQVPAPQLAVLIQRHQLTIRGESTGDDRAASCPEKTVALFSSRCW